jgi:hypothetical protein
VESARDDSTSCPAVVSTGVPAISDSGAAPEGDNVNDLLGPFESPFERDVAFTFLGYASRAQCYGAEHPRGGLLRTRDSRLKLSICAGSFLVHSAIFTFNRTLFPTQATTPVLL